MRRKTFAAAVAAVIVAILGFVTTSGEVSASRGPNKSGVTTVKLDAEDLKLVAFTEDSQMADYPDGAHMVWWTYRWENTAGSTWDVDSYSIWNVPYSSGGHTDLLINSCKYNYVSENMCTGGAGDGGTRVDHGMDNIYDTNTFWVRVHVKYGSTTYCRQIYGNKNGNTAVGSCTN